jgi:YHS domain-containing protein
MGWLIRILLVALVIRALWKLLAGVVEGSASPQPRRRQGGGPPERSVPLVRDPVCGTYVVRARALTSGQGDTLQYFCSERCRTEYLARR